ncbi:uncharacterized protein C8R40DRAFT_1074956 [Lentinula edodes]|uniref:uncharacterized protein n=1 Tax=Lentinula edodes TaxID=5353 RepID=UPI001E8DE23A|nr:uncharacterized protein C8R40DRAFT_1074956 [Lentinula edodes]KAH7868262.1 hypothetical protein C8R40DRAFT_1074956 [Lentinula edodes]
MDDYYQHDQYQGRPLSLNERTYPEFGTKKCWRKRLSELGSPVWATDELRRNFVTAYRARLSREEKRAINNSRVNIVKRYYIMDNMLLEDEQFDWLLEWYKIYKCINMRRSSKVNASVAMKELGFIGVARQESNDSGENNICSMRSGHRFADVSSHVGCDPDMNGYTMNRTEMFSIANNDSFPHTLIAESCRNIDIFSDENVPAVSNQNYTSFEDEYQYFVHQYTFEDYLNELSVALGDQSNNEVLASPVEPIFYPNLDETCEHKHELDAVHDFEQSRQYTLQELFNEYDRLVQNSTFAVESSVTQSEVLQVGYGDWNNARDANTSQNLKYGRCTENLEQDTRITHAKSIFGMSLIVARRKVKEERSQVNVLPLHRKLGASTLRDPSSTTYRIMEWQCHR